MTEQLSWYGRGGVAQHGSSQEEGRGERVRRQRPRRGLPFSLSLSYAYTQHI